MIRSERPDTIAAFNIDVQSLFFAMHNLTNIMYSPDFWKVEATQTTRENFSALAAHCDRLNPSEDAFLFSNRQIVQHTYFGSIYGSFFLDKTCKTVIQPDFEVVIVPIPSESIH